MKKSILYFIIGILLASLAFAQDMKIMPPIPPDNGNIMGGNQYYTVNFDGEGEAAIIAKIEIQNIAKENLKSLSFEIPGSNVRIINIVQEYYEKQMVCSDYEEVCTNFSDGRCNEYVRKCRNYYEQVIYPPKYYPIAYEKETLSKSNVLRFNLPQEIKVQESATVLVYYKSKDYTENALGAFKVDFETIKLSADTQNVRVSLDVGQDLVLEGKKAAVNYRDNFVMAEKSFAAPMAGAQSDTLQQLSSFVTYSEGYVKTASGLDPLESFSVKARYGKSWLALHWFGTIMALLGLVVFCTGMYALYVKKISRLKYGSLVAKTFGLGTASAVLTIGLWFLASFLVNMARQSLDYQTANMFAILVYLMTGLMVLIVFLAPSVYMGVKHGLMAGVWTIVATVAMMFVLLVIVLIFFLLFGNNPQYPGPIYRLMGGAAETMAKSSI